MSLCRAVLIYGTKTGVELTALGKPVIVAGEAWIRGKGISDRRPAARSIRMAHESSRDRTARRGDDRRARRYAYHYFFRRMIPLLSLDPMSGVPPALTISRLDDVCAGEDAGLDVICRGILEGSAFIYDGT